MTCPVCLLVKLAPVDPEGAIAAAIGLGVLCSKAAEQTEDGAGAATLMLFTRLCERHKHAAALKTPLPSEMLPS